MAGGDTGRVRVWDLFVRIAHWVLVVAFFTSYFTEGEPEWLHTWSGYLIVLVVLGRIVWGFVGSRYARFSEFVRPPGEALRYLRDEILGRAARHIGHNPAGAAMILALLLSLLVTAGAGMTQLAMDEGEGPLAGWLVQQVPRQPVPPGTPREQRPPPPPQLRAAHEVHEIAANITLVLVILHIAGVILGSWRDRENLVRAMVTGYKRAGAAPDRPDKPRRPLE